VEAASVGMWQRWSNQGKQAEMFRRKNEEKIKMMTTKMMIMMISVNR
jgi:hypothetical protein